MTTKKKTPASKQTVTKRAAVKSKTLMEPATATKATMKASVEAELAAPPAAPARAIAPVAKAETVAVVAEVPTAKPVLTIGMLQKRLYELGFYGGHWDGHYGPMTKEGIRQFQASKGLGVDGDATPETLTALGL